MKVIAINGSPRMGLQLAIQRAESLEIDLTPCGRHIRQRLHRDHVLDAVELLSGFEEQARGAVDRRREGRVGLFRPRAARFPHQDPRCGL